MKILFVVNGFYADGNGLSASARRTVDELRKLGVEIRILSMVNSNQDGPQPDYQLRATHLPVFQKLVERQGYCFAHADRNVIRQALEWADLIHIEEPFWLQVIVCRIAKKMHVPCVGTYHLHPENLFSSIHLRRGPVLNTGAMLFWRNTVFNRCMVLQCPTENVRERLERWHYRSELRVISNGMLPADNGNVPAKKEHPVFTVVSTGRYSIEKDQRTLLRAMKYSAHAKEIQLVLAGRGPREEYLKKYASRLLEHRIIKHPVRFCYCTQDELKQLYSVCDLYVHCAVVEVEGLSCTEALGCGLVPVIAKAKLSATSQFALDDRSLFKGGNARELASKIDRWFEHRDELAEEGQRYAGLDLKYDIRESAQMIKQMYIDALAMPGRRK